jgi:hypothetical protein
LRVKSVFSKRRNVPVTKDFDVRIWTGVAQRFEGWQSENEIADRAAADYQNAVHLSCKATALWVVFILKSKRVCGDRPQAGGYRIHQSRLI